MGCPRSWARLYGRLDRAVIVIDVHPTLRFLLPARSRAVAVRLREDATSTLGHAVESIGVPLTEVGQLLLDDVPVPVTQRAATPGRLRVEPVTRPQRTLTTPARFLLDVHLGSLTRRLRLLGLDAAYRNDADDAELVEQAIAEQRTLLTQDRGLLRRRALPQGAFVRGTGVDEQADDVLDRFAPSLAPWTRCSACGALLEAVARERVDEQLRAGTRRTYQSFSHCTGCGRAYWRGAHARRLDVAVLRAERVVAARSGGFL